MVDKKKVLVTGGAGYIGTHTAVELIEAGYEVVILDNLSNSSEQSIEGVRAITHSQVLFEKVDCTDRKALHRVFMKHKFHATIHFAALKSVYESVERPLDYYCNNVGSLINLLMMMCQHGVRNVVFSSSCTVYGPSDVLPVTESSPIRGMTTPYGRTKKMCEEILFDSVQAHPGMRGVALRYFNPIGAHPSGLIGELPQGVPGNLVPYITQTAAGVREELSVFGSDYNTPDGTALRDYIDVVDLAKAHVKALDRMFEDKHSFEVFNVGTGRPVSVLELIKTFEKVNAIKLNYKMANRRTGDVEAMWGDSSRARVELGWEPERTLEQTLAAVWLWEKRIRGIE